MFILSLLTKCTTGDFVIVFTMAKLMHAVVTGKAKFEMWRPTERLQLGPAPAAYVADPKWYDSLRKRVLRKADLQQAAKSCQSISGDIQWNLQIAVKMCFCTGLSHEATQILERQPTLRSAIGLALQSHPDVVNHRAETQVALKAVIGKHLDDSLRKCDLLRTSKLLKAAAKMFGASCAKHHRLVVTHHILRGIRQYLIRSPVPVENTFHLPAPLERGLNQIRHIETASPAQEESGRRWNIGVATRFCFYVLQPAMRAGNIRQLLGDYGWSGPAHVKVDREDGEVSWISELGAWGDFVFPFRLLARFLWFQHVRDEYSMRWRHVHQLHSRRTTALARIHRGESISYHRGVAPVDGNELKDEKVALCCAAVRLLPFDDIVHINQLHELVITCVEDIERDLAVNDPEDDERLRPLCALLMLYLPEFGQVDCRRHQILRKQIAARSTVLDNLLLETESNAGYAGIPSEQMDWQSRLTQQGETERECV